MPPSYTGRKKVWGGGLPYEKWLGHTLHTLTALERLYRQDLFGEEEKWKRRKVCLLPALNNGRRKERERRPQNQLPLVVAGVKYIENLSGGARGHKMPPSFQRYAIFLGIVWGCVPELLRGGMLCEWNIVLYTAAARTT